jgi:hypothetical protein
MTASYDLAISPRMHANFGLLVPLSSIRARRNAGRPMRASHFADDGGKKARSPGSTK